LPIGVAFFNLAQLAQGDVCGVVSFNLAGGKAVFLKNVEGTHACFGQLMIANVTIVRRGQKCAFEQIKGAGSKVVHILTGCGLRCVNSNMPA
jgi:hypothetical protein